MTILHLHAFNNANPWSNSRMQAPVYSSEIIEEMIDAMCSTQASDEEKDLYRDALRGLVRLAQAEQLLSMQLDFHTLNTGSRLQL
jgi:hypothetical protein